MDRVSSSSASADAQHAVSGADVEPPVEPPDEQPTGVSPSLAADVRAGLLTLVVSVLAGAPVGLLWAVLAPQATVAVTDEIRLVGADSATRFIAADGYFLAAVVVAGVVAGLLAWRYAAAHGPAVVLGLALGGLLAAWVAATTGAQLGADEQELLAAGPSASEQLAVRLRSTSALGGWPLAALLAYVYASVSRTR